MASLNSLLFKYTTDASRFLVVDSLLIHYRDEGEGEPLVLLHGAFSSLHTYNDWVKHLKKHYRVIRLDIMGFGLTGPNESDDYSMNNHMRILKTFLNILKVDKCYMVGNSLGGWLSWEFTIRYPERVKKLVLIDSAGFLEEENIPLPFKLARSPIVGKVIKYVVKRPILEQFVKQVYYNQDKVTEQLINRYYDLFTRDGNNDAFLRLVNQKVKDNSAALQTLTQPTLIMWGKEDVWIPVENAYRFKQLIKHANLLIYPEVGHVPMEEIPEESVLDLLNFLQDTGQFSQNIPSTETRLDIAEDDFQIA